MTTYLDQLTPTSTNYTVKTRVIEKSRKKRPLPDGWTHQTFVIQDEKGNNMKGRLIGPQIEAYKNTLLYRDYYEITNAPITYCPGHYKTHIGQLDHVMEINEHTSIKFMPGDIGTPYPRYICLAHIPSSPKSDITYDVLAILLYADQRPQEKKTESKYTYPEKTIIIIDNSVGAPSEVELTSDLAEVNFQENQETPFRFTVIGLTALRPYPKKELKLLSTISTEIITRPECSKATALEKWSATHTESLTHMRKGILAARKQAQESFDL